MTDTMLQGNQKYDNASVLDVLCVTSHLNPITRFKFITKPPHQSVTPELRKEHQTKMIIKKSGEAEWRITNELWKF